VIPNLAVASTGRSAAHSAIATNERAPAVTAHTATTMIAVEACPYPYRDRVDQLDAAMVRRTAFGEAPVLHEGTCSGSV